MNKKNKFISLITAIIMVMTVFAIPVGVSADTASVSGSDVPYQVEGGNIYFDESTGTITGCDTSVTAAVIPQKIKDVDVVKIGREAFGWCYDLKEVSLPDGLTQIDEWAFYACKSLKNIEVPGTVKTIGACAFQFCESLETIVLGDGIERIETVAFGSCNKLKGEINIPESVTYIEGNPFYVYEGNNEITAINVDQGNSSYSSKDGVLFNKEKTQLIYFPPASSIKDYEIPETVTSIHGGAFKDSVIETVTVPGTVKTIASYTFEDCNQLMALTISEGVSEIEAYAVSSTSLTKINVPASVSAIEGGAFCRCSNLQEIEVSAASSHYMDVDGVLFNKNKSVLLQYPAAKNNETYDVPASVKEIGDYAFYMGGLAKEKQRLKAITLPQGVTKLGDAVFLENMVLESVVLPDSITEIGDWTFDGCTGLATVVLPIGLKEISLRMFYGCANLKDISLPEGITKIDTYGFYGCSGLRSIEIPEGVTRLSGDEFDKCTSLTKIVIPSSVTYIEKNIFNDSPNLTIYGYTGSVAETHAKNNGIPFVALKKNCETQGKTHAYGTYTVVTKATFGKDGVKEATCKNCEVIKTEAIKAIDSPALSKVSYTYNGKSKKPTVTVKNSSGTVLKSGVDYTVSYAKGRKSVGKYKVTVALKGSSYDGKKTVAFKINPKGVKVSKISNAKKAFTVKWKKPSSEYRKQMTGYQIRYSISSKMTKAKTITVKGTKATSKKIKKLKAKKKYYVQIRTYKTVKGVKYYSSWSAKKSVKTK